jgi:hypothetical protein
MTPKTLASSVVAALRSRKSDSCDEREARDTAKEASAIAKEGASTGPVPEVAVVMGMITVTISYTMVQICEQESTKQEQQSTKEQ